MSEIKWMKINTGVSVNALRGMVSRIPCENEQDTLDRCAVAERWIRANEVISDADYDELMAAVDKISKPIWDRREAKAAAAFEAFTPVGNKEYPLPIRQYYEQAEKAGCGLFCGGLESVSFEQAQYYDISILRDKCGNLWESLYPVGD
jgi:hypothetical protein